MKIWFDLSNSPHINMFYELIKTLEFEGHQIIITSRPLANTIALLEQRNLKHTVVGKHYGKNILLKLFGFPIRILQLIKFLKKIKPDLAVSQSSFHSPLVAKILGISSIYTNDNEHALGNYFGFKFSTKILLPELMEISIKKYSRKMSNKTIRYPGLKEGIYLWKISDEIRQKRILLNKQKIKIYFRPEPQTAQYYTGKINFMDDTLCSLQQNLNYDITILPRDNAQLNHYKNVMFKNISISNKPESFLDIASTCSLFIGAGGSMTRELAILGIPTISVYQDKLLEVDKYLIKQKLLIYEPCLTSEKIDNYINSMEDKELPKDLIIKGKIAFSIFKNEILNNYL